MIFEALAFLFTPKQLEAPAAVPIPVVEKEWKCPDCTPNEQYVLAELQEHTRISDRKALATIMGNIQQESKFIPNICEKSFLRGLPSRWLWSYSVDLSRSL